MYALRNRKLLEFFAKERSELEKFLFEESNKINKVAIKFILEKWAAMELRLQNTIMENEVLKEKCRNLGRLQPTAPSYAQASAGRARVQRPSGPAEVKKEFSFTEGEFFRQPKGEDKRNNEQIKDEILNGSKRFERTLK